MINLIPLHFNRNTERDNLGNLITEKYAATYVNLIIKALILPNLGNL